MAPGYRALPYPVPKAGSYSLPIIGNAEEGQILDSEAHSRALRSLYGKGKVTLLSFIYATCDDVNGCPLATAVMQRLQVKILKSEALQQKVRFLTLSFNPEHDTPAKMADYGKSLQKDSFEWQFLTTRSEKDLEPILKAYQQVIDKEIDSKGSPNGRFAHLLRVYLIDPQKRIRNIYSTSVLHPDLVLADMETLLMAEAKLDLRNPETTPASVSQKRLGAGDDKSGYEATSYVTHSMALPQRTGQSLDLLRRALETPLGLPRVTAPKDNPLSKEKVLLGRKLFFDRRLSFNNTFSCAMCHVPEQGFTSQEQKTSIGVEGRTVRRNAPTLLNVAYKSLLFHDGREFSLENQVWGPLLSHNEMANPSMGFILDKVKNLSDYQGLFEKAFKRPVGIETLGNALATYERTLILGDAPFDRWLYKGDRSALTVGAQKGYDLFVGQAGCSNCHSVGKTQALFTDNQMHNTGLGYKISQEKGALKTQVQVAPGVSYELDHERIDAVSEEIQNDLGRYEVTQDPNDRWKYVTPTLRNITLTAPYMHDGSMPTLRDVLKFYNQGGIPNETLDPLIKPLGLSEAQLDDLEAFLKSLTGHDAEALVMDAWSAPVGDRH